MKRKKWFKRLFIAQLILLGWFGFRVFVDSGSILDLISFEFDSRSSAIINERVDKLLLKSLYVKDVTFDNPAQHDQAKIYRHIQISKDIAVSFCIYNESDSSLTGIALYSYQLAHENFAYNHSFNAPDWSGSIVWQNIALSQFKNSVLQNIEYRQNLSNFMCNYNYFRHGLVYLALFSVCLLPITASIMIWMMTNPTKPIFSHENEHEHE